MIDEVFKWVFTIGTPFFAVWAVRMHYRTEAIIASINEIKIKLDSAEATGFGSAEMKSVVEANTAVMREVLASHEHIAGSYRALDKLMRYWMDKAGIGQPPPPPVSMGAPKSFGDEG